MLAEAHVVAANRSSRRTRDSRAGQGFGHTFVDTPAQSAVLSVILKALVLLRFGNTTLAHCIDPDCRDARKSGTFTRAISVRLPRSHLVMRTSYLNVVRRCSFMRTRSRCSGANQPHWRSLRRGPFQDSASGKTKTTRYIFPTCTTRSRTTPACQEAPTTRRNHPWFFAPDTFTPRPSLEAVEDLTGFKLKIMDGKLDSRHNASTLPKGNSATCQLTGDRH